MGPRVMLAPLNRRSENIVIEAVVIAELEFGNVERQIFAADFVEATDNAALEDAPKAFNRVRVDRADNVTLATANDKNFHTVPPHAFLFFT